MAEHHQNYRKPFCRIYPNYSVEALCHSGLISGFCGYCHQAIHVALRRYLHFTAVTTKLTDQRKPRRNPNDTVCQVLSGLFGIPPQFVQLTPRTRKPASVRTRVKSVLVSPVMWAG